MAIAKMRTLIANNRRSCDLYYVVEARASKGVERLLNMTTQKLEGIKIPQLPAFKVGFV